MLWEIISLMEEEKRGSFRKGFQLVTRLVSELFVPLFEAVRQERKIPTLEVLIQQTISKSNLASALFSPQWWSSNCQTLSNTGKCQDKHFGDQGELIINKMIAEFSLPHQMHRQGPWSLCTVHSTNTLARAICGVTFWSQICKPS